MRREVHAIEERAANAWPPAVQQYVDGWRLRWGGTTRRTNSVLPQRDGQMALADKLAFAEAWYAGRGSKVMFQISPACEPPELDDVLARRGYALAAASMVQHIELAALPAPAQTQFTASIVERYDSAWFEAYARAHMYTPSEMADRSAIMQRIGPRTAFATLGYGAEIVAVGLGVLERDWLGMFSIATFDRWRRKGAATALVQALGAWGRGWGAKGAYLQVEAHNAAGLALYQRLGFQTCYGYHYREAAYGLAS